MKINVIDMLEDELKSTRYYFEWAKQYVNKDREKSDVLLNISRQELEHAKFWKSWVTNEKSIEKYNKEFYKLYELIYGGDTDGE